MKYTFSIDEDIVSLKYKDKEFKFKVNVQLVSEMQGLIMEARKRIIEDYAEKGKSVSSLTIETKKDGKTYLDNSNMLELEKIYQAEIQIEFFDKKCLEYFGMNLASLMMDIGLSSEQEGVKFSEDLMTYMSGNTPRGKSTK